MYLQKRHSADSESDYPYYDLIQLLKIHGAEDRYYAAEGLQQPSDAIGLPQHILESERRQQRHEECRERKLEDHQDTLGHELKLAGQRFGVREAIQRQRLRHQWESVDMRHQQYLHHQAEDANQDCDHEEMRHQQHLQHQGEDFEYEQYRMTTMAESLAQIQEQQDYQRLEIQLEELENQREAAAIRMEEKSNETEMYWQTCEAQARTSRRKILARQQRTRLEKERQQDTLHHDYQMHAQKIMAQALSAMIEDRSNPAVLAALQEMTIVNFTEQNPDQQLFLEN